MAELVVPTAVKVAREQALVAEKYISNGDEMEVLNEFNVVQMSNVCLLVCSTSCF